MFRLRTIDRKIKDMIRLGIFTDELSQDFEEAVKIALQNKIRNLEVRGLWGKNVGALTMEEMARVESILAKYGVEIADIGSPFLKCSLGNPEEYRSHLKILDNCIAQAHQYETEIIRIFTFWRLEPVEKYWEKIIDKLRKPVKKAEQEEIILAVETEGSTNVGNCSELRKLFDSLPSENLKACWDIANSYFNNEIGYPDGYELVRGEIVHVHLKDFIRDPKSGKKKRTFIGEGIVPYKGIFRDLLIDQFDGVAAIEAGAIHFKEKGKEAVSRHVTNLRNILSKVQDLDRRRRSIDLSD